MSFTNPQYQDFVNQFTRDFPYSTDPAQGVTTNDVANAFARVNVEMNQALFPDQATYILGYLYLTAHYLVLNLRASSQGLNGQWSWLQNNKSVDSVSEGLDIPDRMLENPQFSVLSKTHYGVFYFNLVYPFLIAQAFCVHGRTHP